MSDDRGYHGKTAALVLGGFLTAYALTESVKAEVPVMDNQVPITIAQDDLEAKVDQISSFVKSSGMRSSLRIGDDFVDFIEYDKLPDYSIRVCDDFIAIFSKTRGDAYGFVDFGKDGKSDYYSSFKFFGAYTGGDVINNVVSMRANNEQTAKTDKIRFELVNETNRDGMDGKYGDLLSKVVAAIQNEGK